MKYRTKQLIKNHKSILIAVLLLMVVVLLVVKIGFSYEKSFEIEDKCGKFVNLVSHTIEDEDMCRFQCRAKCISQDYKYAKVEFEKRNVGCNLCTCFCK